MGRQISFRLPKHWVVFEEGEVIELLRDRPDIWERGIERGKTLLRAEREGQRRCQWAQAVDNRLT